MKVNTHSSSLVRFDYILGRNAWIPMISFTVRRPLAPFHCLNRRRRSSCMLRPQWVLYSIGLSDVSRRRFSSARGLSVQVLYTTLVSATRRWWAKAAIPDRYAGR